MGGDDTTPTATRRTFLRTVGGATAAAATAGAAAAQDETTTEGDGTPDDGTETEGTPEETDGTTDGTTEGDGGGGGTEEVIVGPDGDFTFEPGTDEPLAIQPGTTVLFVWDSDTHNIVVENQPDDAEWEGYEEIENTGFEYEHTFEVEGTYDYYCEPHRQSGMEATIEVSEDAGQAGGGGGEAAAGPQIPDSAKTLGIISVSAMLSVLSLAYVFLKYGGDYGEVEA